MNESVLNATSLSTSTVTLPLIEAGGGVDLLQEYARIGRQDVEGMTAASHGKSLAEFSLIICQIVLYCTNAILYCSCRCLSVR